MRPNVLPASNLCLTLISLILVDKMCIFEEECVIVVSLFIQSLLLHRQKTNKKALIYSSSKSGAFCIKHKSTF